MGMPTLEQEGHPLVGLCSSVLPARRKGGGPLRRATTADIRHDHQGHAEKDQHEVKEQGRPILVKANDGPNHESHHRAYGEQVPQILGNLIKQLAHKLLSQVA